MLRDEKMMIKFDFKNGKKNSRKIKRIDAKETWECSLIN